MYSYLIVDDEPIIRKGIRFILENSDLPVKEIEEAGDGEEAMQLLKVKAFNIVIADINMPKMDGIELCRLIHKNWIDTAVFIVTGYSEFKYAQEAIHSGVKDYILKPVSSKTLIPPLADYLNKSKGSDSTYPISYDKVQLIINQLEKGLWEDSDVRLEQAAKMLFVLFKDMPVQYCVDAAMEILKAVNQKIYSRVGSEPQINIQKFDSSDRQDLYDWVINSIQCFRKEFTDRKSNAYFDLIEMAKCYIEDSINVDITLEEIAKKVGLNPSYFSQVFREKTGTTFVNYRSDVRMKKAIELLCNAEKSITEITFDVGYHDITHLRRKFKKYTGLSPSEYRRKKES